MDDVLHHLHAFLQLVDFFLQVLELLLPLGNSKPKFELGNLLLPSLA